MQVQLLTLSPEMSFFFLQMYFQSLAAMNILISVMTNRKSKDSMPPDDPSSFKVYFEHCPVEQTRPCGPINAKRDEIECGGAPSRCTAAKLSRRE